MYADVHFRYVLLKLALVISAFVAGYLMSKSKNSVQFWRGAFVAVLAFAVVEGLRFGRLVDWNIYYIHYQEIGKGISDKSFEPLFQLICKFLYRIGVPYWGFVAMQCSFLMFSCCLLFQDYKKYAVWMLPPLIYVLYMNENFIRWFFAASFLFVCLYYMQKESRKRMVLFYVAAVMCHSGMIIFLPIILFEKILDKYCLKRQVMAVLFLAFTFFISIQQLQFLTTIASFLSKIGLGQLGHLDGYLKSANYLINGRGAADLGFFYRSFSNQIRLVLEYLPLILLAPKFVKQYRLGNLFYNLFVLGAVLDPVFSMVEILGRFSCVLLFFSTIVGGIVYYHVIVLKEAPRNTRVLCLISFICGVWPSVSIVFANHAFYDMTFIWDRGYMEYLPTVLL